MTEMLKMTREMFDLPFNDNIRYEEGDDISKQIPNGNLDAFHRALEQIYSHAPKLILKDGEFKKGNLSHYNHIVENVEIELTEDIIHQFKHIFVKDSEDSEEEALQLAQDNYDGVSYYAGADFLWLPIGIKHYVEDHQKMKVKVAVYDFWNRINFNTPFENLCQLVYPKEPIDFPYIPDKIKYSVFEERKFERISTEFGDWLCLFVNAPYEYYSKHIDIDCRTLAYNITENCWVGHSNDNFSKMNHLCYSVAKNGLPIPVAAEFCGSTGNCILYASNKKQMMAQYIRCPTIPLILIVSPVRVERGLLFSTDEVNKELANSIVNPEFLVI